jgi:PAS domain S-box-containing protein
MATFTNTKTGEEITRAKATNEEFIYEGKPLLIETDMEGVITYANRRFVEVSGYTKEELIGSPHCVHMHPNMPQSIFKDACQKTLEGKTWSGYVCNISKEGIGYWTELIIQPKNDEDGKLTGFMATRRAPDANELENVMEEYEQIKTSGNDNATSQYCGEVFTGRGTCQL